MTTTLPRTILSTDAVIRNLGEILKHFDPDSFEKADTKYRKSSYQRNLDKPKIWNQSLVESILAGRSIGAIVMSKWTEYKTEDGIQ